MSNLTSSVMEGRKDILMDKINYQVRYNIEVVYNFLRGNRSFDYHGLLNALKSFETDYIASFGQTDISLVIPTFSAFKWIKNDGSVVGVPIAIPFGLDSEGNRFNIYIIGNNLSESALDSYITN